MYNGALLQQRSYFFLNKFKINWIIKDTSKIIGAAIISQRTPINTKTSIRHISVLQISQNIFY